MSKWAESDLTVVCCSSQLCPTLCNTMDGSTPGLLVHHQQVWVYSNSCPLSQWCHPTMSSSVTPFFFCLHSFSALESFAMRSLFASGGQSIGASASASVLPMNSQDWLVWSPCITRDSQESSPLPQFKGIHSSVLSLLYGSTLTSKHDYWKNHSFGSMDLYWQSDVSAF